MMTQKLTINIKPETSVLSSDSNRFALPRIRKFVFSDCGPYAEHAVHADYAVYARKKSCPHEILSEISGSSGRDYCEFLNQQVKMACTFRLTNDH